MFGLGAGELLVILVLALLFLGPSRLPEAASTLGRAIRSFRKATNDLQEQLEVDDSVKQPFRELQAALRDDPAPASPLDAVRPATRSASAPAEARPAPSSPVPVSPLTAVAPSEPGTIAAASETSDTQPTPPPAVADGKRG
jgi:sec-independent protein translocase protein TatB